MAQRTHSMWRIITHIGMAQFRYDSGSKLGLDQIPSLKPATSLDLSDHVNQQKEEEEEKKVLAPPAMSTSSSVCWIRIYRANLRGILGEIWIGIQISLATTNGCCLRGQRMMGSRLKWWWGRIKQRSTPVDNPLSLSLFASPCICLAIECFVCDRKINGAANLFGCPSTDVRGKA